MAVSFYYLAEHVDVFIKPLHLPREFRAPANSTQVLWCPVDSEPTVSFTVNVWPPVKLPLSAVVAFNTMKRIPWCFFLLGRWNPEETRGAVEIFSRYCGKRGAPQLVLDVGSHVGYYSLLAAAFGCKAFAFDGNKEVLAYLNMSIALNDFSNRVRVFEGIVSKAADVQFDGWRARPKNVSNAPPVPLHAATKAVVLDDVVRQPVLYVKASNCHHFAIGLLVDVGGWEPAAFLSGRRIFTKESPLYVFFEMTYYHLGTWKYEYLEVMQMLKAAGYMCKSSILQTVITLPETKSQFDDLLRDYSSHCDPTKVLYCQDEFLCVHPSAKFNLIASKPMR
ncbi:hypothetical protein VOLCADRAFT_87414 [Volvox carteri f. nagariensis]|uniref:Methyltransferase FkbM domain-containing protein n=1 Tax=Volvox carteri f. nagariensis TaxID=3068 RepID=D8TLA4_VOLCA|nr:uncharacterized protein VOLCADRAFT_87414 [Volvox carteri f. nagariensis]EFJ51700.1 hypothetical protein VOLCADRAFT_87414 [Volvox carteri f. nagariensis]|eukprot:XP_002947110.1 hypothetical protein VOLCADRAFT_87414 [Volvox carteri f. nagariensis]